MFAGGQSLASRACSWAGKWLSPSVTYPLPSLFWLPLASPPPDLSARRQRSSGGRGEANGVRALTTWARQRREPDDGESSAAARSGAGAPLDPGQRQSQIRGQRSGGHARQRVRGWARQACLRVSNLFYIFFGLMEADTTPHPLMSDEQKPQFRGGCDIYLRKSIFARLWKAFL